MEKNHRNPKRLKWQEQPLPLPRLGALIFFLLMAYASLNPFDFQFDTPVLFWDWMAAPLPKYITLFDVWVNVLGYLPFGFLMVFALFPRVTKWNALLQTLLLGMIFSGVLESLQTYLPSRVSTNVDWWANSLGTLIGALFALPFKPVWLSGSKIEQYRFSWFGARSSFFLLFLLFPWAQIYPQNAWLGMSDFEIENLRVLLFWNLPINNATQEVLITTLAIIGTGSFFFYGLRPNSPKLRLIMTLIGSAFLVKALLFSLQYRNEDIWIWLTINACIGMSLGLMILTWISKLARIKQWWIALFSLSLMVTLVNLMPLNPYHVTHLELLQKGRLTHFNSLFQWLTWIWPWLAFYTLFRAKNQPFEANRKSV